MQNSVSETMTNCGIVVNSLNNAEIKSALAPFGYTEERITAILGKFETTEQLVLKQSKENKDMFLANENFFADREVVDQNFKNDLKISELSFSDNPDLSKIVPSYTNVYPYPQWYKTVSAFYNNLQTVEGALAKVARFNLTTEIIDGRIAALKNVDSLHRIRTNESGEAQIATAQRNDAIDELIDICREIKEIAKIAFGKKSQILEKMGILVRN